MDDLAPFRGTIRHGQGEKEVEDPRLRFFCLDRHVFDVMEEDGAGLYYDLIGFDPCDRRTRIFLYVFGLVRGIGRRVYTSRIN